MAGGDWHPWGEPNVVGPQFYSPMPPPYWGADDPLYRLDSGTYGRRSVDY